jgi:hypothetical protein
VATRKAKVPPSASATTKDGTDEAAMPANEFDGMRPIAMADPMNPAVRRRKRGISGIGTSNVASSQAMWHRRSGISSTPTATQKFAVYPISPKSRGAFPRIRILFFFVLR